MDMEWSKSRYDGRNDEYNDDGLDKSSRHRSKDRKKSDKYIEKDRERNRDEREKDRGKYCSAREKDYDREKHRVKNSDRAREKGKEKTRDKEREKHRDREIRSRDDRGKRKAHEEDYGLVNLGKHAKASKLNQDDKYGETSAYLSSKELEEGILKMKEIRTKEQSDDKSRKLEKERVLQLSKIFEEQDNIVIEGSDINDDVSILENVEIGEQKCREDAYKVAKKKTDAIYDDKFNDDSSLEKKILPKYDDLASEEGLTLDERGRFSDEAEKKLEELQRSLTGVSSNNFEDLASSGNVSSDYYSHEKMPQFKKPKKKKSLRKKDKLDINALEAEAVSSGLGVGDLGSRKDAKRQAIKDEQERCVAEMRNKAYRSAYSKADEASKLLHPEQSMYVEIGGDATPVFADDDEDLRKSLEKARQLDLKKQEEKGEYGLQAIALLATSNPSNETMDDQNSAAKEAYRILSQKFHGVEPGKMKQEKRMKQFHEELKLKQMKSSDTPLLFAERMREFQVRTKTPYVVLSGRVKPGQTSDPKSGFASVEKDVPGGLTPLLG